jgi:simple sugar transport system ATP-binding protein
VTTDDGTDTDGAPIVLEAQHLSKRFGAVTALSDVSIRLARGEVLGLIGDNGAGKSTLMKILCGFHQPDSGRLLVDGQEVTLRSVDHARVLGIDTVYQDLALINELSVYHNMFLNRELVRWPLLRNRDMKRLATQHLAAMGIRLDSVDVQVAKLSGGQRQAIAVARSVYSDAKILLLDEPLAAMGAKEGALILDLIRDLRGLGDHHRPQLRPGARGLRPGEPAPARRDQLRPAGLGDLGPGADRPGRRRVPRGPRAQPDAGAARLSDYGTARAVTRMRARTPIVAVGVPARLRPRRTRAPSGWCFGHDSPLRLTLVGRTSYPRWCAVGLRVLNREQAAIVTHVNRHSRQMWMSKSSG